MKKLLSKISLLILTVILSGFVFSAISHAAVAIDTDFRPGHAPQGYSELYDNPSTNASENFTDRSITYIIADVAVVLIQMSGILAIFFLIMSGFNYIKAFGQEEEIQKAKKGMTWAIIGLITVIMSYAIVQNVLRITLSVDPDAIAAAEETAADKNGKEETTTTE